MHTKMKKEEKLRILLDAKTQLESELSSSDLLIIKSLDEVKKAINLVEREITHTTRTLNEFHEEGYPKYVLVNKIERDLYRDTPVRYLGYASEVGESFRPQVSLIWVKIGYGIAGAYVVADTLDKARRAWEANQQPVLTAADTLLWQSLATMIFPAVLVNRIVWAAGLGLNASMHSHKPGPFRTFLPTLIGLLSIPLICKPVDHVAEYLSGRRNYNPPTRVLVQVGDEDDHLFIAKKLDADMEIRKVHADKDRGAIAVNLLDERAMVGDKFNKKQDDEDIAKVPVLTGGADTTDIYRDSYLRYLGYTNELGESFRPLVPRSVVNATYGVSIAYVLADTWDKAMKAKKKYKGSNGAAAVAAGDTLLWQGFASVIIPGLTINRIIFFTSKFLQKCKISKFATITPTAVGLLSIPMIIKPIDHLVDVVMDNTYRKVFE